MHWLRREDVYSGAPPSRYRRFVTSLATTRSRKMTRSLLKEVRIERERGDISTIGDEGSVSGAAGA
jgi:acyl-coenzyme A synthetase/AMP-(fatty) acid ligase